MVLTSSLQSTLCGSDEAPLSGKVPYYSQKLPRRLLVTRAPNSRTKVTKYLLLCHLNKSGWDALSRWWPIQRRILNMPVLALYLGSFIVNLHFGNYCILRIFTVPYYDLS